MVIDTALLLNMPRVEEAMMQALIKMNEAAHLKAMSIDASGRGRHCAYLRYYYLSGARRHASTESLHLAQR